MNCNAVQIEFREMERIYALSFRKSLICCHSYFKPSNGLPGEYILVTPTLHHCGNETDFGYGLSITVKSRDFAWCSPNCWADIVTHCQFSNIYVSLQSRAYILASSSWVIAHSDRFLRNENHSVAPRNISFQILKMLEAKYEQTPDFLKTFVKNYRYHISFEEQREGKDFGNDICCAFGWHWEKQIQCYWAKSQYTSLGNKVQISKARKRVRCVMLILNFLAYDTHR